MSKTLKEHNEAVEWVRDYGYDPTSSLQPPDDYHRDVWELLAAYDAEREARVKAETHAEVWCRCPSCIQLRKMKEPTDER